MKKSFLFLFVLIYNFTYAQNFELRCNLKGTDGQKIYLRSYEKVIDSSVAVKDYFVFKGKVKVPDFYTLSISDKEIFFVLENAIISIDGDVGRINHVCIEGANLNAQWDSLENALFSPVRKILVDNTQRANQFFSIGDSAKAKEIIDQNTPLVEAANVRFREIILYRYDYFGLFLLSNNIAQFDLQDVKNLMSKYNDNIQQTDLYKFIQQEIEYKEKLTLGSPYIPFKQTNVNNDTIHSEKFRGKVFLLEFWASWCAPCREQNPFLVELYKSYNAKGFEILGISVDTDKNKWLMAIEKDGLKWEQVSDLKDENEVALLYNIKLIPQNYLISDKGIIIGQNLEPAEIKEKLAEIYGF